ncbi:hypothetical protein YPPY66_4755 [Yersinia pestis PY-66]|uniref:Uncharacterized protein n=4 Tax=Yersinia pseudotuberculosis complex TaxID=1649845 RepID=Q8CLS3_YERPE|nr:hypothetical [Yersinia pestis KIM10+]ABS47947.1 hypothetical protein YpsIP31758_0176 [Yersinia pseudotuberculosis IP 31758]ADV97100.1 hypothetical protein YPC_0350 [Yersinia pestis biovar Medievalis str. Harbin 35]EDR31016.1 hypothetical protein YPIP275_1261 [Yersinia pestis biovar Orientalis str. IP275]EDR38950.1 hypothetical protein YpF1991016_4011 [Yersinia pestis biovar Orientalis str. F1991016]EDR43741.1 hypothetical protein YpE1979001_3914 [Yersinia pestis biovar Antiqua str. E1979001
MLVGITHSISATLKTSRLMVNQSRLNAWLTGNRLPVIIFTTVTAAFRVNYGFSY